MWLRVGIELGAYCSSLVREENSFAPANLQMNVNISFATRAIRMLNYGAIAPVFFLYLEELGYSATDTGVLLTAILLGHLVITLYLSTR
jgi:hypothetical protein